jgi:hypothetical protein
MSGFAAKEINEPSNVYTEKMFSRNIKLRALFPRSHYTAILKVACKEKSELKS